MVDKSIRLDANIGNWGRHHHFASELAGMGHDVTLIAARKHHLLSDGVDHSALPEQENLYGYRFVRIKVPSYANAHDKRRVLAWLAFCAKLAVLKRSNSSTPDVIFYSSPQLIGFLGALILAWRFRAKLVFEVRDIWPLTLMQLGGFSRYHPLIWFMSVIERAAYRRSNRVISNLYGAADHMVTVGLERQKFAWIPNGVSLSSEQDALPLDSNLASLVPETGLRIIYAGTLGHANALENLVEAASLLTDLKDVSFLIVGRGKEEARLKRLCAEKGLTSVVFLGSVRKAEVPSVLALADVAYIGLKNDPLFHFGVSPNKLFDYFSAGLPVIYAIDSGSYRPVEMHDSGWQVPPEDPLALANLVREISMASNAVLAEKGKNGKAAVEETYNYQKLAVQLEKALLEQ